MAAVSTTTASAGSTSTATGAVPHDYAEDKPDPPVVGKVTDTSVELYWQAMTGHPRYILQESEKIGNWGNIYNGAHTQYTVRSLRPSTTYRYRLRALHADTYTQWSPIVVVSTTKKQITGEDIHKAVSNFNIAALRDILDGGYVSVDIPDQLGFSPLMNASQRGFTSIVEELLQRGADVNYTNSSGKSSLMLASCEGHVSIVEILLRHNADLHQRDKSGAQAIHWAADSGNAKIVKILLAAGAEIDSRDWVSKWTPLMKTAAITGNADVGMVLLEHKANPNLMDSNGKTALMIASLGGHLELIKTLLSFGAKPALKSPHGKTALDFAVSFGHTEVRDVLEKAMGRLQDL